MSEQIELSTLRPIGIPGIHWPGAAAPVAAQRCVALPFTSPSLCSPRSRLASQGGLEMLLSNPSGGRGIYVFRWQALRAAARPSVHDILLVDCLTRRCSPAEPPTPARVRAASLEVAAAGHLGRRGTMLAGQIERSDSLLLRRLRAHLLLELARALRIAEALPSINDPWRASPREDSGWLVEAPRLLVAHWHRREPGRSIHPQELDLATRELAALALPLGLGPDAAQARLPRLLRRARKHLRRWRLPGHADGPINTRLAQAEAALQDAVHLLHDPLRLIDRWRHDRSALLTALEQPDWLLDGWDRFCLLDRNVAETATVIQLLLYEGDNRSLRRAGLDLASLDLQGLGAGRPALSPDTLAKGEALRLRELELQLGSSEPLDD